LNCPHSQHLTDKPIGFAPRKIQKRAQMALRMVALARAVDGRWFARKGIPKDVRDEVQGLFVGAGVSVQEEPLGGPVAAEDFSERASTWWPGER
jgi:hypothetical protein